MSNAPTVQELATGLTADQREILLRPVAERGNGIAAHELRLKGLLAADGTTTDLGQEVCEFALGADD